MVLKCEGCGKVFKSRKGRGKYCTYLCYAMRMVKKGVWSGSAVSIAEKQGTGFLTKEKPK